jgi:hypothetical protein
LIHHGFAPLCPQLTCYINGPTPSACGGGIAHETWLAVDLPWLACADAVLRLPGASRGADTETDLADDLGIPVFKSVADVVDHFCTAPPESCDSWDDDVPTKVSTSRPFAGKTQQGDPRFLQYLDDLRRLHLSKGHDYADQDDPLRNYVVSAADNGLEPWQAAMTRLSEKYHRLTNLLKKGGEPNYESLDDTFMDLAAMALIVRSLRARTVAEETCNVACAAEHPW